MPASPVRAAANSQSRVTLSVGQRAPVSDSTGKAMPASVHKANASRPAALMESTMPLTQAAEVVRSLTPAPVSDNTRVNPRRQSQDLGPAKPRPAPTAF